MHDLLHGLRFQAIPGDKLIKYGFCSSLWAENKMKSSVNYSVVLNCFCVNSSPSTSNSFFGEQVLSPDLEFKAELGNTRNLGISGSVCQTPWIRLTWDICKRAHTNWIRTFWFVPSRNSRRFSLLALALVLYSWIGGLFSSIPCKCNFKILKQKPKIWILSSITQPSHKLVCFPKFRMKWEVKQSEMTDLMISL